MKTRFSFFTLVAVYYVLSSIFLFWKVDSFAKDVLIAPLYFIVPAGIGLLVLSLNGAHRRLQDWLTRPQLVLSGAFVGFVAVSLLHLELERTRTLQAVFPWLFPSLKALSLFGYYRSRQLLSVDALLWNNAVKMLLLLLPFAAFAYYFQYLYFSSFPLRDIFQETHFMKGAHELSRTQVLNPYITASYLPIIQILLGQLHHFYGLDLLRANWILPVYAYFFHLACYAVFFSSFLRDRRAFRFALVLMTVLGPMFYIENMIMLESMLLVLFSILIRPSESAAKPEGFWTTLVLLVSLFVVYHFYSNYIFAPPTVARPQSPAPYTSMWVLAVVMFAVAVFQDNVKIAAMAFLALVAVSAFGMHRGILLFLPMILLAGAIYCLMVRKTIIVREPGGRIALVASVLAVFALGLLAAFTLWFLNRYGFHDTIPNGQPLATGIAEYLLRTTKIEGGGTGFGHSLVEYLRLSSPLSIFATLVFLVWFLVSSRKRLFPATQQGGSAGGQAGAPSYLNEVTYLVLVVAVLSALALSTIPYAYRGAFFPVAFGVALLAGLMTEYAVSANDGETSRGRIVPLALALLVYMLLGLVYLYSPSRSLLGDANTYLSAIRPLQAVMAAGGILLFGLVAVHRRNKVATNALFILTVTAIAFDAVGLRTLFSEKAYGAGLPESRVISHYTPMELDVGRVLRSYPAKTILISDPYTLSILRGVSGLNSAYSFANINLVSSDADEYRHLLRYIAALGDKKFSTANADRLFAFVHYISGHIAGEAMYFWNRVHTGTGNLVTVDDIYRHFVWVVNAKTFRWAEGEGGYYSDNSPLPANLVSRLQDYFDMEMNLDGRLLVMRLKRQPALTTRASRRRSCACACPPPRQDCLASIPLKQGAGKSVGE